MNYYGISGERYLAHHGIKGMKWGVRRYQNPDGTYTAAGLRRRRALDDATAKAKRFKTYADNNARKFEQMKSSGSKQPVSVRDLDRWINVSKKQSADYKRVIDTLKGVKVDDLDRKKLKAIEKWVKTASFEDADYTDVRSGRSTTNYQDRDDLRSSNQALKKMGLITKQNTPFATMKEVSNIERDLQNDTAFMNRMNKMRSSGATERQISEAWNKELDRRVDKYIEKRDNL